MKLGRLPISRVVGVILVAAAYLLTLASADPIDVLMAVAISIAVIAGLRRFLLGERALGLREVAGRALRLPAFALVVLREIVVGTWQVALVVSGLRQLRRPGIVRIPIGERTPNGVAVTALAITLSPGELLVDVDWDGRVMLIHVIDASDPDGIRARYEQIYERYQRQVFP
ncbi:MAG TPA: Na+/H+ antiporter subunit E [Solirubrobacterales bacterium]|nr:Na+/H+ antiporter subunit E [Solirubrobacterales bacterium]